MPQIHPTDHDDEDLESNSLKHHAHVVIPQIKINSNDFEDITDLPVFSSTEIDTTLISKTDYNYDVDPTTHNDNNDNDQNGQNGDSTLPHRKATQLKTLADKYPYNHWTLRFKDNSAAFACIVGQFYRERTSRSLFVTLKQVSKVLEDKRLEQMNSYQILDFYETGELPTTPPKRRSTFSRLCLMFESPTHEQKFRQWSVPGFRNTLLENLIFGLITTLTAPVFDIITYCSPTLYATSKFLCLNTSRGPFTFVFRMTFFPLIFATFGILYLLKNWSPTSLQRIQLIQFMLLCYGYMALFFQYAHDDPTHDYTTSLIICYLFNILYVAAFKSRLLHVILLQLIVSVAIGYIDLHMVFTDSPNNDSALPEMAGVFGIIIITTRTVEEEERKLFVLLMLKEKFETKSSIINTSTLE
ncbi:hypothetical protein HDU76_005199 [Blyttiomyces sp. JEL0837]|nr:hypothetical protein HDU76_005199 [Blyttiomyces sp. JEL0837]